MNINIFHICSILFSLVMMLSFNALFLKHFSESDSLEKQVSYLLDHNHRQELEIEMQEIEMQEFKLEVARVLPQFDSSPKSYEGRQLASVVGGFTNIALEKGASRLLLREVKKSFSEKKYDQAKIQIKGYNEKYPQSIHIPENYLMLIEMEYSRANYEKSIKYIDYLVSAYPANEITGHALFVLGDIMQKQERLEDASDLYRTIIDAFPVKQMTKRAKKELRAIGLN